MTSRIAFTIAAGVFGLLFGSFLNVVIHRMPRSQSMVRGRSMCPHCKKSFTAEMLPGSAERYRGFKCPHCKLFVPAERATG